MKTAIIIFMALTAARIIMAPRTPWNLYLQCTAIFRMAIRASQELGIDEDKAAKWQDMLQKLAPLPTTAHPDFHNDRFDKQKPVWVNAVGNYEISSP